MHDDLTNDPNAYFRNLQQLANEQDRAKLTTLAVEFGSVLQRLPRMKAEMEAFLLPNQSLDYSGLLQRLEPSLEQAATFLDEVDFLPTALKQTEAVQSFIALACNSLTFRTVGNIQHRLQTVLADAQQPPPEPPRAPDPSSGWAGQTGQDQYGRYAELVLQGVKQRFRWIEAGTFMMGSPPSEAERNSNETQHRVTFQQGFWMADTACTQALWQAVMGDNPAYFSDNPENPVEQVSWDDVQIFLQRANDVVPEMVVRLPSEAEWEYACRAGTTSAFSFGNRISPNQANYDGNYLYEGGGGKGEYRQKTLPVKSFSPNAWGLYQMHGNVWEWCQDTWDSYDNTPTDGRAGTSGDASRRVLRGGSWYDLPYRLRSAYRYDFTPDSRGLDFGFRLVVSPS